MVQNKQKNGIGVICQFYAFPFLCQSYGNFMHFLFFISALHYFTVKTSALAFLNCWIYTFMCVTVCGYLCVVCMCVHMCEDLFACVCRHWGHKSVSGSVFYYSPSCFLRQRLSLNVKLAIPARLASQRSLSLCLSPLKRI